MGSSTGGSLQEHQEHTDIGTSPHTVHPSKTTKVAAYTASHSIGAVL